MLEFIHVSAGYQDDHVLHDLSLTILTGENLCIIGPNGSGKTTLLKIISGLIPYKGSILLNGNEVRELSRRQLAGQLSYMEQSHTHAFSYSIYETVLMGRYHFSQKRFFSNWSKEDHAAVEDILGKMDLWDLKDRSILTLSGGQLQRVYFARTLVQNTPLILLDEPTNHLDLKYQMQLVDSLSQWSTAPDSAIIGVFHDINLAMDLSDTLLLLHKGEVMAYGSPSDVLSSRLLKQVYEADIVEHMVRQLQRWENFTL